MNIKILRTLFVLLLVNYATSYQAYAQKKLYLYAELEKQNEVNLVPLGKDRFIIQNNTMMTLHFYFDGTSSFTLDPSESSKAFEMEDLVRSRSRLHVSLSEKTYQDYIRVLDYFLDQCLDFDPGESKITIPKILDEIKFYQELSESGFGGFTFFPSRISPCYNLFLVREFIENAYHNPSSLPKIFYIDRPAFVLKNSKYYRAHNSIFIIEAMAQRAVIDQLQIGSLFEHNGAYTASLGFNVTKDLNLFGQNTFTKFYLMGSFRYNILDTRSNFDTIRINPAYIASVNQNNTQVLDYSGLSFNASDIDIGIRMRTTFRRANHLLFDFEGGTRVAQISELKIADPSIPEGLQLTESSFSNVLTDRDQARSLYASFGINYWFKWHQKYPSKYVANRGGMIRVGMSIRRTYFTPNESFPLMNQDGGLLSLGHVGTSYLKTVDIGLSFKL